MRANASSVKSDLGGGGHGYLGLVLDNVKYNTVSNTVFQAPPAYPTALSVPTTATQVKALILREQHKKKQNKHTMSAKTWRKLSNVKFKMQLRTNTLNPWLTMIPS